MSFFGRKAMKINPGDIQDESFRTLLSIFNNLNLELAVWGGACRDLMFSEIFPGKYSLPELINDFDIAVILHETVKLETLDYRDFGAPFRLVPAVRKKWERLCDYWGANIEDFCREENILVPDLERPVGIAGLRVVHDSDGRAFPDCFAIGDTRTFNSVPVCLSVNSFAIDGAGNMYGPSKYIDDFKDRTARALKPPELNKFAIPLLLRLIDYIRRFELEPEKKTKSALREHLDALRASPAIVKESLTLPWTRKLFEKEFGEPPRGRSFSEASGLIFERLESSL